MHHENGMDQSETNVTQDMSCKLCGGSGLGVLSLRLPGYRLFDSPTELLVMVSATPYKSILSMLWSWQRFEHEASSDLSERTIGYIGLSSVPLYRVNKNLLAAANEFLRRPPTVVHLSRSRTKNRTLTIPGDQVDRKGVSTYFRERNPIRCPSSARKRQGRTGPRPGTGPT